MLVSMINVLVCSSMVFASTVRNKTGINHLFLFHYCLFLVSAAVTMGLAWRLSMTADASGYCIN
jgi:hypothetical protein